MALNEDQLKIVEILTLVAETISDLYKLYADKFPTDRAFWLSLATDATNQADSIRNLQKKAEDGSAYFNVNMFTIDAIQGFLKYINEKITEIKSKEITMREAAAIASNIENAGLEKNFFDIFEVDSIELKHLFADLADATKKRKDAIGILLKTENS
jgi:hypothetical protein